MSITVKCAQCGKKLTAPDKMRGKRAKCSCGAVIEVPAPPPEQKSAGPEPERAEAPAKQPVKPQPGPSGTRPASVGGRRRVSDRYKRRKSSPAMTYIGIGGAIAAVVVLVFSLIPTGGSTEPEKPETTVSGRETPGGGVPAVGEAATEGEKSQEEKPADEPPSEDKKPQGGDAPEGETKGAPRPEPEAAPADVPEGPPPLKEERPVEDFFDR